MAFAVTSNLSASVNTTAVFSAPTLSSASEQFIQSYQLQLSAGTGANAANVQWLSARTLADGASETLALQGVLTAADGTVINFANIKAIIVANLSTLSTLILGGAASNAWTLLFDSHLTVPVATAKGAGFVLVGAPAGLTVTGGASLNLKVAHGGQNSAALNYQIGFIGQE